MKTKKILFVCKYNRFRSQIAESYFNKINKNKSIRGKSVGIIRGWFPLDTDEVKAAKSFGIKIKKRPESVSTELLRKIDQIIIVASDVPKTLFENVYFSPDKKIAPDKIIEWKIPDFYIGDGDEKLKKIITLIMTKVEELVKEQREQKK